MGICHKAKARKSPESPIKSILSSDTSRLICSPSRLPLSHRNYLKLCRFSASKDYKLLEIIGSGGSSQVWKCLHIPSQHLRALKKIPKDKLPQSQFRSEIRSLRKLDNPHVIKSYDFFEDNKHFYIVTELCQGGMLFHRIVEKNRLTEEECADYARQILRGLAYIHASGMVHRDLKPENLLIHSPQSNVLKIADFGSCGRVGSLSSDFMLTKDYTAPEIFEGEAATDKSDIWSCGIIVYMLLTGRVPSGKTQSRERRLTIKNLQELSPDARYFINKLLKRDPNQRISAVEALSDRWLSTSQTYSSALLSSVVQKLATISKTSKLKQAVKLFLVHQVLAEQCTREMREQFEAIDTNKDGRLSRQQLINCLSGSMQEDSAVAEASEIMCKLDTDGSGFIDYTEFLKASLEQEKFCSLEKLQMAFNKFDIDHNGFITVEEIKEVLEGAHFASMNVWEAILNEGDLNHDGKIDLAEFIYFMTK